MRTISVVTLNFNQSRFLGDAVRSLQVQQMRDWSLTIVDPGSTDGAEDVYRLPFITDDNRISILRKSDRGPGDGLNNGFTQTDSKYCYYLNADDRVLEGAFGRALGWLERNHNVSAITGHGWTIDEFGRPIRRIFSDTFDSEHYLRGLCVSVQQSTFFRRSMLDDVGGFNPENTVSWDGEFLLAANLRGHAVKTVNQYWGEFRVYAGTVTSDPDLEQRISAELLRMRLQYSHGAQTRLAHTLCTRMASVFHRRVRHPRRTAYLGWQLLRRQRNGNSRSTMHISSMPIEHMGLE